MTDNKKSPDTLRSARWFAPDDLRAFGHRSRAMQMGYAPEEWKGRPVIAILNTWSDAQPCHMHFKSRVDDVKRGILMAGGFPMELPALSLSESFLKPTTMLYRNLLAMDAEELLRGHPVDGVVLMGGCDKTTPACLMAAATVNLPAIVLSGGPMIDSYVDGKLAGSALLGQSFTDTSAGKDHGNPLPQYFQPRPSDAGTGYQGNSSGASNLGPSNPLLVGFIPGVNISAKRNPYATPADPACVPVDPSGNPVTSPSPGQKYARSSDGEFVCYAQTVPERAIAYRQFNDMAANASVPVDAVTASASGLDPDISIQNAIDQVSRVARFRHLPAA